MSEDPTTPDVVSERVPGRPHTGVSSVDDVLGAVESVAQRPVAEHAAVFERAHDGLRRTLDARPEPTPGPPA